MTEQQEQGAERIVAEARRLAAEVDAAVYYPGGFQTEEADRLAKWLDAAPADQKLAEVERWLAQLPALADPLGAARLADDAAALRRWVAALRRATL